MKLSLKAYVSVSNKIREVWVGLNGKTFASIDNAHAAKFHTIL